jgi:hypothetical protein
MRILDRLRKWWNRNKEPKEVVESTKENDEIKQLYERVMKPKPKRQTKEFKTMDMFQERVDPVDEYERKRERNKQDE